jgi:type VI protein secretion system component VasK
MSAPVGFTPTGEPIIVKPQSNWSKILIWFLIILLIVLVIFWILRPAFLLKTDANGYQLGFDWGRLILVSVLVTLLIVFLIWLFNRNKGAAY